MRPGPLPQESFFGYHADKGCSLGASNLSRPATDECSSLASLSAAGGRSSGNKDTQKTNDMSSHDNLSTGSWWTMLLIVMACRLGVYSRETRAQMFRSGLVFRMLVPHRNGIAKEH
ncbi:hypothetical protein NE237_006067 [Protea cynaroides]|uniref:Uncharacterized protein n=1 Tax=Protea cynaroides TaxID=273540 RepID=A0A9Q0KLN0_9MAGN|nr:hypothetical protein NE237_006067 [Protea cynaroides]